MGSRKKKDEIKTKCIVSKDGVETFEDYKKSTEVVKIRICLDDKIILQNIAKKEFRSFADQCRLALHEWIIKTKNGENYAHNNKR